MSKSTPGPWFDDGGIICGNGSIADVDGFVVAYVDRSGDWPRFQRNVSGLEMRANARLIAQAPRMLEALRKLSQHHHDTCDSLKFDNLEDFPCTCGKAEADAIIAAIEGDAHAR